MFRFLNRSARAAKLEHATAINTSQTNPFSSVSEGILSELKHIDLSDRVDLKTTKVVEHVMGPGPGRPGPDLQVFHFSKSRPGPVKYLCHRYLYPQVQVPAGTGLPAVTCE